MLSSPPPAKAHDEVKWYLPERKRPFTSSTQATSDLIKIYAEDGSTWRQILAKITYDRDAAAIVGYYIEKGFGDARPYIGPLLDENSYTLWWPGKRQAILEADRPVNGVCAAPCGVPSGVYRRRLSGDLNTRANKLREPIMGERLAVSEQNRAEVDDDA